MAIINKDIQNQCLTIHVTNDPEKLKDGGRAMRDRLLHVSTVVGNRWGRMYISEEILQDQKAMDFIALQLIRLASTELKAKKLNP